MDIAQSDAEKIRPSRWYYLVALALLAAGAACGGKFLVEAINTMQGGLTQAIFPGETSVSITTPGEYQIFYEDHSMVGGRVFDTGGRVPGMNFTVTDSATGEVLPVYRPKANETYQMSGRTGRLVLQFHVSRPGSYKVAGRYADGEQHEDVVFAVGNPQIGRSVGLIFATVFCVFVFGGGALLVIVVIEVKRAGAKRRVRSVAPMGTVRPGVR